MNDQGFAKGVEASLAEDLSGFETKGAEVIREIGDLAARAAEGLAKKFECGSGNGSGPVDTNSPADAVVPGQG